MLATLRRRRRRERRHRVRESNPLVKNELMGCTGEGESEGWKWNDRGFLSGEEAIECGRWGVYRHWQIKIQFGLERVTESQSQERQKRVGGENPVSPTITAIILMWPTFPTAYRFSAKRESHISLSSPRAVRVAVCISWQGNTYSSKCVQTPKRVYVPTSVEADILRHPLSQGGHVHQHCHHQQGFLVPWWR